MCALDLSCEHCGHRGPVQQRETVLVSEDTEHAAGFGLIHWKHFVTVYQCVACDEVTISEAYWADEIGEAFAEKTLFPTARDDSAVPERVRNRFAAAIRVRKIDPGFYAIGVRRMLETVCNVEGAQGGTLFAKLDDLAGKGRIPSLLAEIAHELREMGNLAAHDDEIEVAPEDVPLIEDLADAILEYLYRAPAKLAAVQGGMAKRKAQET
jgi:DNA-directed RNA polymerase subunit RPC12/RpoP